jgi:hypothetical protein
MIIAHVAGVPVEELLVPALVAAGALMAGWRRPRRHREHSIDERSSS